MRAIVGGSVIMMAVSLAFVVAGTRGLDFLLYIGLTSFGVGFLSATWVQLLSLIHI